MSNSATPSPTVADTRERCLRRYTFIEHTTTVNACTIEATSEDDAWDRVGDADWITIAVDSDGIDLDRIENI
jgi:hypothetical protein